TDSPIHFPSVDEVIKSDGNLIKATLDQIKNLPISTGGLVTIGNKKLNPNYVDVQITEDGSIQIFTFDPLKPNEKHLSVALSQTDANFKYPKYETRDGSYVDHRSINTVYEIFKQQAKEVNGEWTLPLSAFNNNEVIKQLLAKEFKKPETGLVDIEQDTAKLSYLPNLSKLVLKGSLKTNKDQEYILVINDVKNVILARELYSNNQVLDSNPSNAIINALEAKAAKNDFNVGIFKYKIQSATYKELEADQKVKSDSNIVDINNKLIYVIDDYIYKSITSQTWEQAIKNNDQLDQAIAQLNQAPNQFIPLNQLNNPELTALAKAQGFDLSTAKVATIDGKLQFVGVDANNNPIELTVPYINNVVSSDYVTVFDDSSLVQNNGDLNAAIKHSLTNEKLYPRNDKGEIKIGNHFVRPEEVLIDVVDGAVQLSIRDPNNLNKTKQLSKILLNKEDNKIAKTNYFGYSGNNLNKEGWADVVRDLNNNEQIKANKPTSLEPFLSSLAINQVIKKGLDLSKATIEYNADKTKIVIRDNLEVNGNVFVIYDLPTASSLQSDAEETRVHTWWDDNARIWAPVLSAIIAILIATVGIVIGVVRKRKRKNHK
ncbi:GUMAP protein, partial [Ureaplasma diversum]|uniref:GUMAP protein n=1 Tax=Ureaplasma diversum TaxID=42094 RepID=UPI00056E27A2